MSTQRARRSGRSLPREFTHCVNPECGADLAHLRRDAKYCSRRCCNQVKNAEKSAAREARRGRPWVPSTTGCETCGADLGERRAARPNGPVRFCSDDCWKEAYYGRPEWPLERRDYNARFNFNLPPGRYIEMVHEQGGLCAISGCDNDAVSIDHDHRCCDGAYSCGRCVRAILCRQCNSGIGMLRDNAALLRAGAEYLQAWDERLALDRNDEPVPTLPPRARTPGARAAGSSGGPSTSSPAATGEAAAAVG
ncbi:endonuclease domain-containing protein [Geodermatophilus sp. SYSU D00700]